MLWGPRVAGKAARVTASAGLDDPASLPFPSAVSARAAGIGAALARTGRSLPWEVCVITAVAGMLRFTELDDVGANQFYDAAVRSMSLSWHNFFFGAFDPGGLLSIDKPPLDLWLQVVSVKLFGWNPAALKLPEALGGTLSVPLLYDAVRRVVGKPAGLVAATTLAVLPESVLTSRSDTMDSLMMLLLVAALWFTVRASLSGRGRWLAFAGVAVGLAFNVKLFEGLIAAPALFVLYAIASPQRWATKVRNSLLAGATLVGVALSWAIAASLAPGRHPFPVGSTDGSVWNVMFVFNGFSRVSRTPSPHHLGGPGPLRLVHASPYHFNLLLGCVLIAALALGGAAVFVALWRRRTDRLTVGFAVSLALWIALAVVVFDKVTVLHARYLEALAPALAAAVGFATASLAGLRSPPDEGRYPSALAIAAALGCICAYTFSLRPLSVGWGALALAMAAVGAALLARADGGLGGVARWACAALIAATALLFPVHESLRVANSRMSDSMGLAVHKRSTEEALWNYLEPRTAGIRYELAVDEPLALAPLIIRDQRPIIPLTSFQGIRAVGLAQLQAAVQAGEVRYGLVGAHRCRRRGDRNAACVPAALWIRRNGVDISRVAGVGAGQRLYLLLPA